MVDTTHLQLCSSKVVTHYTHRLEVFHKTLFLLAVVWEPCNDEVVE